MRITEEQRKELFQHYYSLGNLTKQWQFLAKQMVQSAPKRRNMRNANKHNSERRARRSSVQYYLQIDNNERIKVCQPMFMATFAITRRTVLTVVRKSNSDGNLVESDLRGRTPKIAT